MTGTVYLVGAGPGDAGLMTVRGLRLLQQADAVLYDALVNPEILYEAPPTAEMIDVGKRASCHKKRQEQINQLLIELAHHCQVVVRLKGGDPFVFGRGGEEMLAVRAAGIPVEVVPGVSSSVAALAYAGVPITHRRVAGNFAVVTGHRAADLQNKQQWAALAQLDTVVILMGLKNLPYIVAELLAHGRNPNTPAMAVRWGTLPQQEVVRGTLCTLVERVQAVNLQTPATIVIGEVVDLAEMLTWFEGCEDISQSDWVTHTGM